MQLDFVSKILNINIKSPNLKHFCPVWVSSTNQHPGEKKKNSITKLPPNTTKEEQKEEKKSLQAS